MQSGDSAAATQIEVVRAMRLSKRLLIGRRRSTGAIASLLLE
jgi:hypothetical protein